MKASTSKAAGSDSPTEGDVSVSGTSTPVNHAPSISEGGISHTSNATETTVVAPSDADSDAQSTKSIASSSQSKSRSKSREEDEATADSNLIGKINNLVTTDLNNITDGRDFMFLVVYAPLMTIACVVFLYEVLGWRCVRFLFVIVKRDWEWNASVPSSEWG